MKVGILVGDFGSQITEETMVKPMPKVEVDDKSIIWHIMKLYEYYGLKDRVIALVCRGN